METLALSNMAINNNIILYIIAGVMIILILVVLIRRGVSFQRAKYQELATGLGLRYLEGKEAAEDEKLDLVAEGNPMVETNNRILKFLTAVKYPRIAGKYKGIRVVFYREVHSSNHGSHSENVIKAYLPVPIPFSLRITRENFFERVAKALGGMDIEVNDEEFDRLLRVKASDELPVLQLFRDRNLRKAMIDAYKAEPHLRFNSTHIYYKRQRRFPKLEEMKKILDIMVALIEALPKQ
jgi:hypothetical protein